MSLRIARTAAALTLLAAAASARGGWAASSTPSPPAAAGAAAPASPAAAKAMPDSSKNAGDLHADSTARPASLPPFDLSGTWRLDLAASGEPPRSEGHGGGGRHGNWGGGGGGGTHGGGGHGHGGGGGGSSGAWGGGSSSGGSDGGSDMGSDGTGHHGSGVHFGDGGSSEAGPPPDGDEGPPPAPHTPGPLPELLTIKQDSATLNFSDSTGTTVIQVTMNGSAPDTAGMGGRVQVVPGRWMDEALQVQRPSWRGSTLLQTFTLEDEGDRLVVNIHLDMHGLMPPVDAKKVYNRVGLR